MFADYRGLNVAQMTELRTRCREANVRFKIAKNTLTRIAMTEAGMPDSSEILSGPTGLAISLEDEVSAAKVLTTFAKEHDKLEVKGGVMEGQVLATDQVKALADLPGKNELIAGLLAGMESSVTFVVTAADNLVNDILSCAEQAAEQGGAAAPAAASADEPAAEAAGDDSASDTASDDTAADSPAEGSSEAAEEASE